MLSRMLKLRARHFNYLDSKSRTFGVNQWPVGSEGQLLEGAAKWLLRYEREHGPIEQQRRAGRTGTGTGTVRAPTLCVQRRPPCARGRPTFPPLTEAELSASGFRDPVSRTQTRSLRRFLSLRNFLFRRERRSGRRSSASPSRSGPQGPRPRTLPGHNALPPSSRVSTRALQAETSPSSL